MNASEPAFFRVCAIEIAAFEHADEEVLREILRLVGWIPAATNVGVERIPVRLAQRHQSRASLGAAGIGGRDHQRPPGGRESGSPRQRVHRSARGVSGIAGHNRNKELDANGYTAVIAGVSAKGARTRLWRASGPGYRRQHPSTMSGMSHRQPWPWSCLPTERTPDRVAGVPAPRWDRCRRYRDDQGPSGIRPPPRHTRRAAIKASPRT